MLPDYLSTGLRVVIVGTAVGDTSAQRGHYYAGSTNTFWKMLQASGLVPVALGPEDDTRLCQFGIGLTDLVKTFAQSHDRGLRKHYDVDGFTKKIADCRPIWVAFNGLEAARAVGRNLGRREVNLGEQPWRVADSAVFTLPSSSGSGNGGPFAPLASRLDWWQRLSETIAMGA